MGAGQKEDIKSLLSTEKCSGTPDKCPDKPFNRDANWVVVTLLKEGLNNPKHPFYRVGKDERKIIMDLEAGNEETVSPTIIAIHGALAEAEIESAKSGKETMTGPAKSFFSALNKNCDVSCKKWFDKSLIAAMKNPDRWIDKTEIKILHRLQRVEPKKIDDNGNIDNGGLNALYGAEFIRRASSDNLLIAPWGDKPYLPEIQPSTVSDDMGVREAIFNLLPYEFGINLTTGGFLFAYHPTFLLNKNIQIRIPLEVEYEDQQSYRTYGGLGLHRFNN